MRIGLALALAALGLALGLPQLDTPGPYYDETIQAGPARDFLEGEPAGRHAPGLRTVELGGRPFPWRTQVYMGALKSQLLIPAFAVFGSGLERLRLTTLVWSLVGVVLAMAFAGLWLGPVAAGLTGLLLVTDASLIFVSRHDWGSFALGFALRCAAGVLLTLGWRRRRRGLLALGGLALGLGLYNKVDFAAFLVGSAGALLALGGRPLLRALVARRGDTAGVLGGLVVGALPVAASLEETFRGVAVVGERSSLALKLETLLTTLDGSHFSRLLEAGGRFERVGEVAGAAPSLLPLALGLAALAALGLAFARNGSEDPVPRAAWAFPWLAGALTLLLILALPGAGRVHHVMNLHPYPHLALAGTAALLLRRAARHRHAGWLRAALGVALAAVVASQLLSIGSTHRVIARTGGKGWWTDSLPPLLAAASARGDVAVSLDWGFHEPALFLGSGLPAREPIWQASALRARGRPWRFRGGPEHLYLLHDERYDLFGFGPPLLTAADSLPEDRVEVQRHRDREGEVAFVTLRILEPHEIVADGRLRIRLLSGAR